jgi:hypothetical protein
VKSLEVSEMLAMCIVDVPVLVITSVCVALVVPKNWFRKVSAM